MKRGLFITLEGIDGAGKSSHIDTIVQWLHTQGVQCIQTREPGGTPLGEQLRKLILHTPMQAMTELLLVFAARAEHVNTVIKPHLVQGTWVISDRFTDATRAYQGAGRQMGLTQIETLAQMVHDDCQPDLTLIFDIAPDAAASRVQGRGASDRFEAEHTAFSSRVREGYLHLAQTQPKRCVLIDGGQSLQEVHDAVITALETHLLPKLQYASSSSQP